MNKIYKVIWSKVKHQYVVVSELAHSNGKQSRTARRSLRSRIAALVVCGAIAAFGVFGVSEQQAFAAGAPATAGQYIAIGGATTGQATDQEREWVSTGDRPWQGYYVTKYYRDLNGSDGQSHRYIYTEVEGYGAFWVREGYTINIEEDPRFGNGGAGNPKKNIIINTYRGENADSNGLVQSYQNVQDSMNIHTLNGDELFSTDTAMYGGAVNTASTQVTSGEEYIINEGNTAIGSDKGGINLKGGQTSYFQPVNYDSTTGLYHFGDITQSDNIVNTENLYVINGTVGVFTKTPGGNSMNDIYTGDVYGRNNEILMTGVDSNGNYVSYWGAEIVDPNAPIGSMSMSTLQGKFDEVDSSIEKIHKDDIKQIQVASATNGGTIGLQTNGEFNEDGTAKGGANVPGTITVTSEGGTGGKDVAIKFANEDGSFTVDAGSKVEATKLENDKVSELSINGTKYAIGGGETYTADKGIAIDEENNVSVNAGDGLEFTSENADAQVKVKQGTGITVSDEGVSVKLKDGETNLTVDDSGLALSDNLNVASVTATNNIAANSMSVTEVGNSDSSVVNVGYFKDNEKHIKPTTYAVNEDGSVTMRYVDGNGETADGVAKITGIATKADAVAATTEVKAGTNVASVDKTTDKTDGHTVYTVNAKGTEVTGDSNVQVTPTTNNETNVTSYSVKLNDVVNLGSGDNKVKIDGNERTVSGLSNTAWNAEGDYSQSTKAATEAQLGAVAGNAANINLSNITEAGKTEIKGLEKHIAPTEYAVNADGSVTMRYVDGNGETADGVAKITGIATKADAVAATTEVKAGTNVASVDKTTDKTDGHTVYTVNAKGTEVTGDSNVQVTPTTNNETNVTSYSVKLNDVVNLGSGENKVTIDGNERTVSGLSNTAWDAQGAAEGIYKDSTKAATEAQLSAVNTTANKGWSLYITDKDGKQTLVKDVKPTNPLVSIDSGENVSITRNEDGNGLTISADLKDLDVEDTNAVLYDKDADGNVDKGNVTLAGGKDGTKIHNLADGTKNTDAVNLGQLIGKTGDLQYKQNNTDNHYVNNGDNLTVSIGKLDDQVFTNTTDITELQGQTIDGGYVEDGVINLTHKNDDNTTKTVAQIDGLEDYTLQNGQFITKAKDENGKFTGATELTIADRYDPTKTEKVTIDGLVTYNTTQKLDETTGETIVTGIDYDNIRLAGENGTRITNLVDGWVDEKSTDAVNGSQLASVKDGAVKYWQNEDGSYDKSFVQLEGGEDGTLVTHVRDGAVNEYSSDAVNGSQLWETQQQIKDVETTANKHTIVSTPEDSNLTVTNIAKNDEAANYQVELKDDITLGEGNNQIRINGSDNNGGKIVVGQGQKTVEIDNNSITLNKSLVIDGSGDHGAIIHGLSNNNWNPAEKDNSTTAATEGQLYDVYDGSVKYWQNQDGTYDKSFIQLEGGEEGTTITHLRDGVVAEHSTEAINGSQLWETQQQIKDVETTANKHTIVSTTDDSNLTVKNVAKEGEADNYQVTLNDEVVLGDYFDKGNGVLISGNSGTISATNSITVGEDQGLVIDGQKKTIQGLSNTTWTGTTETPNRAATEGQLQNAYDGSVKYWRNEDGTYDKSFIQLEGGEEGTTITHLKDGVVAEHSTEAINGSQLWETQQQIKDVETTANKHTIVSTTKDSNLTVKNVAGEGEADNYQVALKDDITLKGDSSSIELTGTKGTIQVNQETAEGTNFTNINGNVVSIGYTNSEGIENAIVIDGGKGTITGLSNTTWDDELAKQVANSEELQGTAATQGQLQQAVSAVATEAAKQHTTVSGDDNLTVTSKENTNGGTNYQVTLDDDITLGNPKAGNTEGERSFTINTTAPEGYVPDSYKEENSSGAEFIKENGGFMLFATDTQGHGIFGVTAKGSAWAKDFKTYTTDIYGNNTQYSLNDVGDAVAQMSSYYNEENGKSYTVFSRYRNEAEKDKPFETVDKNATRDIPLALRDDGAVLIGATIKGDDFTDNGIRINAETETTYDENGKEVTNNVATITGLENTTWTPPAPVATFANEGTETSRAATEAQLNDLYNTVAAYDVNADGTVNYNHITLAGTPYNYGLSRSTDGTPTGGTSITNVAYASGNDGSEAVNVDYLKDAIKDAVKDGPVSSNEKHLDTSKTYTPDKTTGKITIAEVDGTGQTTGNQLVINDVASKAELDSLKTNVGDLNYDKVTGDKLVNGDSVTTAIGKLDNKIDNISGTATDAANNTVTGGTIKDDGTISLTQKDGGTVALDGKLTDSGVVQDGTKFDGETGTLTITSQDKYNKGTSSVTVSGIASKNDIGTVKDTIGATSKEDLKDAYKDADKDGNATTEYITDSETMVDADVALDHAVQDVANTSYANDMILSNRIDNVESRLGDVEERIDKVGAMAAAIANLRTMGYDPEAPTEVAVGVGQYKSETGIALGIFHYPNQDFMLSASISTSGDEVMGGIGATWRIGRKSAEEKAKDEEERILAKAEEIKQAAKRAEVKEQAERHAKLLAEREAKGEPIVPVEESAEQAQA